MKTILCGFLLAVCAMAADPVTFNKDVLPLLQKDCQVCHRPGEVAPMSFMSYESTRPWAKAIKTAVVMKKMPPWFADPRYGHFSNDHTLAQKEIDTLVAWVDAGALEGNAKDKPAPREWPDGGWQIKPDVVVKMQEPFVVPAKGVVELTNFIYPTGFSKDTWVNSIEIRPGNRTVVHHVVLSFRKHTPDTKYGMQPVRPKPRDDDGFQEPIQKGTRNGGGDSANGGNLEAVYVPGTTPTDYRLTGSAKLVPAGYDIVFGMHYTPNGKETADQSEVAFTLAKEPPARQFITLQPFPAIDSEHFRIPAGDANWETRVVCVFNEDAELVWFMPHMHVRGKDFSYKLIYPTGESETVLNVPRYDFDWQFGYNVAKPITVPKGTKIEAIAHYDNSPNNARNPFPGRDAFWGDQTWEEMMVPWFGVVVDSRLDPKRIVTKIPDDQLKQQAASAR